jgi:hypothetical protein
MKTITKEIQAIAEKVTFYLSLPGSRYFNVVNSTGETIKVRVSDHSANHHNNSDKTISFISARCNQGFSAMKSEYVVTDGILDTGIELEDFLDCEDIISFA